MTNKSPRRDIFESHQPGYNAFDLTKPACELFALFMADKTANTVLASLSYPGIEQYYSDYRSDRIIELLLQIASLYRLTSWRLKGQIKSYELQKQVGLLYKDDEDDGTELSMHEGCNKIIHANEISFVTKKLRKLPTIHVTDQILVAGSKGKMDWGAAIWIPEFCEAALTVPKVANEFGF